MSAIPDAAVEAGASALMFECPDDIRMSSDNGRAHAARVVLEATVAEIGCPACAVTPIEGTHPACMWCAGTGVLCVVRNGAIVFGVEGSG